MKKIKLLSFIAGVIIALVGVIAPVSILFKIGCFLIAFYNVVEIYDLCIEYTESENEDSKYYKQELIKVSALILLTLLFILLPFKVLI